MEASRKKILGLDWIRQFARKFSPMEFQAKVLSQPIIRRMTNEEIINAFPECEKIKKADVAECINKVFDDVKFYREVDWYIRQHCFKFWPESDDYQSDDFKAHGNYFYGDYDTKDYRFREWVQKIEQEFIQRNGPHRTYDEACQMAADEWARMIFGTHVQNNGDQSDAGGMAMVLGTLVKDKAKSGYDGNVIDKFRRLMTEEYREHSRNARYWSAPYCDYHPNTTLADVLIKAGCDKNDVGNMCPWKTGISVDARDGSVCIRGYQTRRYI